jgi:hypothetical protein
MMKSNRYGLRFGKSPKPGRPGHYFRMIKAQDFLLGLQKCLLIIFYKFFKFFLVLQYVRIQNNLTGIMKQPGDKGIIGQFGAELLNQNLRTKGHRQ